MSRFIRIGADIINTHYIKNITMEPGKITMYLFNPDTAGNFLWFSGTNERFIYEKDRNLHTYNEIDAWIKRNTEVAFKIKDDSEPTLELPVSNTNPTQN